MASIEGVLRDGTVRSVVAYEALVALTGLPQASATLEARRIVVRASVGVSVWDEDGADLPALLHSADMRMYATRA